MLRGKLKVEEFENAQVYKWLTQFNIKNGEMVLGYGRTKDKALEDLCNKLSIRNPVKK